MSTPIGASLLPQPSDAPTAAADDDEEAAPQLQLLCRFLQEPAALAAPFRCGRGLPEFATINRVVSRLVSFHASAGPESNAAVEVAKTAGAIMEAISAGLCSDSRAKDEAMQGKKEDHRNDEMLWVLSLLTASLPLMADSLPKDDHGLCVLPHQHSMELQDADELHIPMRLWNGRRVYDTQKICDRCMEAILEKEFYHCSRDCDVDFCTSCHTELQAVLDKHFTLRSSKMPMTHLVERMLWTMHAADELAWQILRRGHHERMLLARLLAEEWPLDIFASLVATIVDVCNAKVLYNASNGAITSSVCRSYTLGQEPYQQQSQPLYEDDSFWNTIGLLQFLYASNLLRKEDLDTEGNHRPAVSALSFVPEAINQCRPEVEWSRREANATHALPDILRSEDFTTASPEFRCLAAHTNILPINFRRSCVVLDIRHSWPRLPARHVTLRRDPELLVADLEAFFCESPIKKASEEDMQDSSTEVTTVPATGTNSEMQMDTEEEAEEPLEETLRTANSTALRQPFYVAFQGEDGQGLGVRKEFFHART